MGIILRIAAVFEAIELIVAEADGIMEYFAVGPDGGVDNATAAVCGAAFWRHAGWWYGRFGWWLFLEGRRISRTSVGVGSRVQRTLSIGQDAALPTARRTGWMTNVGL